MKTVEPCCRKGLDHEQCFPGAYNVKKLERISKIAAVLLCAALAGCGDGAAPSEEVDKAKAALRRDDGPLVLAVMPDLPPYAYIDEATGEICGLDIDIVRAAAAKMGQPLEIRRVLFADMIPSVKDGRADFAAGGLTITEGRRRNVDFSDTYAIEGSAFLYRSGEKMPTMITIESLRVAVVEGMTQDFYLTRHGIDPIRYVSIKDAVKDVLSGKIDILAFDRPALKIFAKNSGGKLSVSPLETRECYGIAVSKQRPDCLAAVNAVIRERRVK